MADAARAAAHPDAERDAERRRVVRIALGLGGFVGLLEGVAIVRYDVGPIGAAAAWSASPGAWFEVAGWLAVIVAVHLLCWGLGAWGIARLTAPDRALRLVVVLWLLAGALGRWLLDRDPLGLQLAPLLTLLVLAVPRPPRRFLAGRGAQLAAGGIAAVWTAVVVLRGWVPGAAVPEPLAFWAASFAIAAGCGEPRAPRRGCWSRSWRWLSPPAGCAASRSPRAPVRTCSSW